MGIFGNLFNKHEQESRAKDCPEEDSASSAVRNEDIPGTLNLGWYYSENKNEFQMAKIAGKDRATHFYVTGATGTGKTKFLEFLINQDIEKGNGFGVIDPHGDLIEDIKGFLACHYCDSQEELTERVILVDPTHPDSTVTFNPLEKIPGISVSEQAGQLISSFKKIWKDSWGVRMEDLMRNSLLALGEAGLTLVELPRFLTSRAFRGDILTKVHAPIVHDYFKRFDSMTDRGQVSWVEPVMNKINALFSDERIRQMFASRKSSFKVRGIMDAGKILLVKLDKGKLHDLADLLGSLLMARIQMAAFSRSDIAEKKRTPFYLYIDEFQNFAGDTFSVVLSEARKYGLSLIMAHQTLSQIPADLRSQILGNTGIQVYFRLNRHDAEALSKEAFEYSGYEVKTVRSLHPVYWSYREEWEHRIEELQNLPPRVCYVKHKIEGGIIPIETAEIEPAWKTLEMKEDEYQEFLKVLPFGEKYLVSRKELETLAQKRIDVIRKEKPIVVPPAPGGGGEQHKFLQKLIRQAAEEKGYRVEIEKQTTDGLGRADVHLEDNGRKIACEISVGSTAEKSVANIEKRLKARYDVVILCAHERKILEKAKDLASKRLRGSGMEKVLFLEPQELFSYLEKERLEAGIEEKIFTPEPEERIKQDMRLKLVIRDRDVFIGRKTILEDREVFFNGKPYNLTDKPFRFLYALAKARKSGYKCAKYDSLFGLTSGMTEKAVYKHIKTIKERIPPLQAYIETLPRLGYNLNLPPSAIEIEGVLTDVEIILR